MESTESDSGRLHVRGANIVSQSAASSRLRRIFSVLALAAAGAGTGCSALPDAENQARLEAENKNLAEELGSCRDLRDIKDGGIISEGTLGVRRLYFDKENIIRISTASVKIDQIFLLWPPSQTPEGLTLEGDPKKLSAVQMGSYWGVQFKADYNQGEVSKDIFVIQNGIVGENQDLDPRNPGVKRYVIKIERR